MNYIKLLKEIRRMSAKLPASRFWGLWLIGFMLAFSVISIRLPEIIKAIAPDGFYQAELNLKQKN